MSLIKRCVCITLASVITIMFASFVMAEVVERVVAKVNGEIITKTELEDELNQQLQLLGPASTPKDEEARFRVLREKVLEQRIDSMLILQVAAARGLQVPSRYFDEWKDSIMKEMDIETEDEFKTQVALQGTTVEGIRKRFEEGLLVQEIRRTEVENKVSISEPEIDKRYREKIAEYTEPAKVRLREVVVRFDETTEKEAREKAEQFLQDIKQGADFSEIARMYSESSTREAGGDLGTYAEDELTEELSEIAFSLAPGEVSSVIRQESAFRILRVEDRTKAQTKSLDEVREQIGNEVYQEKMSDQMDRYLKELREQAIIVINL